MAQSVKHLTLAQVRISLLVGVQSGTAALKNNMEVAQKVEKGCLGGSVS